MNVAELIKALEKMPADGVVVFPWRDESFASELESVELLRDTYGGEPYVILNVNEEAFELMIVAHTYVKVNV